MRQKKIYQKLYKGVLSGLLAVTLMVLMAVPAGAAEMKPREVVRVGFFATDAYHMQDEGGIRSGYGYEFLKMAENYNNWKYEYVGYDTGWQEMLTMLDNGQIDFVTIAQKTPEREAKYDFSEKPVGTGSIILTVRDNDSRYRIGDADTYEGMKIGIQQGTTQGDTLKAFASEQNFSYTAVEYATISEQLEALQSGEIDGAMTNSLRQLNGELVLEEMEPEDFYVIVKKGNTEMLDKINHAMSQMDLNNPGWRTELSAKYFQNKSDDRFIFNKDELEYIDALKETDTILTVASNPDLAPYSSYVDGKAVGIVPQIFEQIADEIGLKYKYVEYDTYEEYNKGIRDGEADIDLTCFSDYGLAEYHGVDITNPYMSTTIAVLTKNSFDGKIDSIAELNAVSKNTTYTEELLNSVGSKYFDTHIECIEAVIAGDVDATYMYTYSAQKAVEGDVRNRLSYSILPEYEVRLAFGVNENLDYRLAAILNEGIRCMKSEIIPQIIQNEIVNITKQGTVVSILYDYPELVVLILGFVLIIIFVILLYIVKMLGVRREQFQSKELARFMGYVCETNELVLEIDMDKKESYEHNVTDGVLRSKLVPYQFADSTCYGASLHPDDYKRLIGEFETENFWERFRANNEVFYFESRAKRQDGTYCWYSYTIRSIPQDKQHPNSFILFKRNIDAVKKKEQETRQQLEDALATAKSASAAKGQFLSRMSHEIRTPLNAVIGYMEIAKDATGNPDKMLHCVTNSDMAAKHLLSIINDVLDISSIESGKLKIASAEFDLKEQLTSISTMFFNQSKEKGIRFEVKLKNLTEEWVIGDSMRVRQILMNLLSNAVKFTPKDGQVHLGVEQIKTDETNVYLRFTVSDTGIGMSKEYQQKLFSPFEQENADTAQKYGGSGLGLSITYNLIQMMGGSVEVNSTVGEGSTFVVSLYFGRSEKQQELIKGQSDYSKVRALVVDDDEGSCEYIKEILKRCKVKCDIVHNGEQAIRQIRRRRDSEYSYNLCIMDWNMPNMDGLETARRIREECDSDIPIIIATAYDVTEFEEQAKEIGINKVIAKPLFQSTMFDLLVTTFGKYEPVITEEERKENLRGLRVLLAEDNDMNMEIAQDILAKAGIIVEPAHNGQEAVDIFTQAPQGTYDVILMDIQMPLLDGYQATGVIRKSAHPEAETIPIIAMTANAFAEDVTAAIASGMNGHIAKPIDYKKLFAVLLEYGKV